MSESSRAPHGETRPERHLKLQYDDAVGSGFASQESRKDPPRHSQTAAPDLPSEAGNNHSWQMYNREQPSGAMNVATARYHPWSESERTPAASRWGTESPDGAIDGRMSYSQIYTPSQSQLASLTSEGATNSMSTQSMTPMAPWPSQMASNGEPRFPSDLGVNHEFRMQGMAYTEIQEAFGQVNQGHVQLKIHESIWRESEVDKRPAYDTLYFFTMSPNKTIFTHDPRSHAGPSAREKRRTDTHCYTLGPGELRFGFREGSRRRQEPKDQYVSDNAASTVRTLGMGRVSDFRELLNAALISVVTQRSVMARSALEIASGLIGRGWQLRNMTATFCGPLAYSSTALDGTYPVLSLWFKTSVPGAGSCPDKVTAFWEHTDYRGGSRGWQADGDLFESFLKEWAKSHDGLFLLEVL